VPLKITVIFLHVALGGILSVTVIVCVTLILFPALSVTLYILVMISGQELPLEVSLIHLTSGDAVQLSASSITTFISQSGGVPTAVIGAGLLAVGSSLSKTVIVKSQDNEFPAMSIAVYVNVVTPTGNVSPEVNPVASVWVVVTLVQLSQHLYLKQEVFL